MIAFNGVKICLRQTEGRRAMLISITPLYQSLMEYRDNDCHQKPNCLGFPRSVHVNSVRHRPELMQINEKLYSGVPFIFCARTSPFREVLIKKYPLCRYWTRYSK